MSDFHTYICTRTTADPYIPPRAASLDMLARDLSDALMAQSGGHFQVGRLAFFPLQRAVPNHILCDGKEVSKAAFPELFAYLGDSQGAAADPDNFKLPDYQAAFTPAPATVVETVEGGTVTTPTPPTPPPGHYPEQTDRIYGPVDSGGRWRQGVIVP